MHATAFTLALSKILGADITRPMHEGKWKDSDFKKIKKTSVICLKNVVSPPN